jgi:hypothetical protein
MGFVLLKKNSLYLIQFVNKEEHICELCWRRHAIIKVSTVYYTCYACFGGGYTPVFVKDIIYGTVLFSEIIHLLNKLKIDEIPKQMFYEIGKNVKCYEKNDCVILESIATFKTTCESARRAIREFSLYCIRYQKDKVNKDIRREICKLIWEDKIKFLK